MWIRHIRNASVSIVYGSSASGIAMQLGLTKERAEELMNLYFDLYPGIKTYIDCSHNMAELNHYVFSWFGQRKMTYGAMPVFKGTAVYNGSMRLAQNVRVQNAASSFGLDCFAHFSNAIKPLGGKSLCTVNRPRALETSH